METPETASVPSIDPLLRALIEESSDAMFVKDRQGRYLIFNQAAGRLVGMAPQDVLGKDDTAVFDPAGAQRVMDRDRRVMESGESETEEEVLTAAGITRVYQALKAPYRDHTGQVVAVLGISRDVTDLKQTRQDLKSSLSQLDKTERLAQIGSWEFHLESEEIVFSSEACRLMGMPDSRLPMTREGLRKRTHPFDRQNQDEAILQTLQQKVPLFLEFRVLHDSGRVRHLRAMGQLQLDSQGQPYKIQGIVQDISETLHASEALLQSDRLLRLVIESLPVGVQVMDLKGNLLVKNPAAEAIWGTLIEKGEARWTQVKAWWHHDGKPVQPQQWASIRAMGSGETVRNEEIDIEAFDGTRKTILNSAAPIRDRHQVILGAVVINEDISERKLLEQQLLHAQKMEAIGQLAAGAAHDFNNLLTIMSGCGELLLQQFSEGEESHQLAQEILEASRKAGTLTRQLLAFSRQSVLSPQELDLNQLIESNLKMLQRLLGEDIALTAHLDPHPCWARIDPVQFDQVLLNLCSNSRDAMPTGGSLIVSSQRSGQEVVVTVQDDGPGMDPETRKRIFEPFFTTKSQGRGSGLGLATVYGIIRQSGGQIEVESQPGQGTLFRIRLPASQEPLEVKPESVSSEGEQQPATLLLVEDQDGVRAMVALALQRAGFRVLQARHGQEALELWPQHPEIELVVTDVVMPGMSGRHLAEQLWNQRPDLKILFISGHTGDTVLHHGVLQSEVDFLQKPFSLRVLVEKIHQMRSRPT